MSNQSISIENSKNNDYWVFGYGSLIFKVDFPIECRKKGFIKGFERRFYQNSIDHRGTPKLPGRVVTLVPSSDTNSRVYGVAYKIPDDKRKEVFEHLDFREKNGYDRHFVTFYPIDDINGNNVIENIVIYVATKDNDSYAGHQNDLNDIANQIFDAHGTSGSNREYLYRLADVMRQLFPHHHDEHLFELEKLLKERERIGTNG